MDSSVFGDVSITSQKRVSAHFIVITTETYLAKCRGNRMKIPEKGKRRHCSEQLLKDIGWGWMYFTLRVKVIAPHYDRANGIYRYLQITRQEQDVSTDLHINKA